MGLDRLGILFIVIILPIALILNAYTNAQVDTLDMQLEYDSKLNACTADAVRTYQNNSLNEDASNLGDVRIGNINAAINVFFTSLSSNLNMSGYSRQFLQEYVPAIVFTMYDGYYVYSKYTNKINRDDYATQENADDINTYNRIHNPGAPEVFPSYYYGEHREGDRIVSQQLYGLKPFVHYSCRYTKSGGVNNYDFVVSYTLDNYITIQGIVDGKPVDRSGYLIDIDNPNTTYNSSTGDFTYRGVKIDKEQILSENLIINTEDEIHPQTKSYKYHKVNGVKYYYDEGDPDDPSDNYWFSMLNGIKNNSTYTFDLNEDDSAYNYYVKAYEFSKWVKENLSGKIYDSNAQDEFKTYYKNENGNDPNNNIFDISGIEETDSNFNQHRRDVIKYTIEKNLSIAIANYNQYGDKTLDFRMPKFSDVEWDLIQKNMTVISYLQGLPIGTKIYNGVSVIPNNVNEEVVAEQSLYIGDGGNTTAPNDAGNYYYSVLTDPTNTGYFTNENSLTGIYNVDLKRREVEYNKQKYYYYPKLYFEKNVQTANIDAETTDASKLQYAYNGNLYKYIDNVLIRNSGSSIDTTTKGFKIAKAFFTALGRERESRYNQRNNYEQLLTKRTTEDLEIAEFNARFNKNLYSGNGKTANELRNLITLALENNKNETDINNRIVIRQGKYPSKPDHYVSGKIDGSFDITQKCVDELNNWTTSNSVNNYVVATMGANTANGYKADLSPQNGKKYNIKYYYFNGKLKAIYVS